VGPTTNPAEFSERRLAQNVPLPAGHSALLAVDLLNDFCDPGGAMPLAGAAALYGPINEVATAMREDGDPVVWIADRHEPGDREFEKRTPHCLAGTWGAEIVPELNRSERDHVVPKRRYSAFFGTDLDLLLRENRVSTVVVTGVVTNICVRSTVHDAFFLGYDVVVVADAVAATSAREQESSLWDIDTHFGVVRDHTQVLQTISSSRKDLP
jgi:ureidoacrylate peracid hydrolase